MWLLIRNTSCNRFFPEACSLNKFTKSSNVVTSINSHRCAQGPTHPTQAKGPAGTLTETRDLFPHWTIPLSATAWPPPGQTTPTPPTASFQLPLGPPWSENELLWGAESSPWRLPHKQLRTASGPFSAPPPKKNGKNKQTNKQHVTEQACFEQVRKESASTEDEATTLRPSLRRSLYSRKAQTLRRPSAVWITGTTVTAVGRAPTRCLSGGRNARALRRDAAAAGAAPTTCGLRARGGAGRRRCRPQRPRLDRAASGDVGKGQGEKREGDRPF